MVLPYLRVPSACKGNVTAMSESEGAGVIVTETLLAEITKKKQKNEFKSSKRRIYKEDDRCFCSYYSFNDL